MALATVAATIGGLYFNAVQARQAREAQSAERFSRSVEQLGSPSLAVRIGAVASLDQLWQESEDYEIQVLNVMSSFISVQMAHENEISGSRNREGYRPLPEDVTGAMAISQNMNVGIYADDVGFSGFDLSQWFLEGASLRGADLTEANLSHAYLGGADLTGADLIDAELTGANLTCVQVGYGPSGYTELQCTNLTRANLSGADLTGANLTGADLTGADLTGADLTGAGLTNVACDSSTRWPTGFTSRPQCI